LQAPCQRTTEGYGWSPRTRRARTHRAEGHARSGGIGPAPDAVAHGKL